MKRRRRVRILLGLVLVFGMMSAMAVTAYADGSAGRLGAPLKLSLQAGEGHTHDDITFTEWTSTNSLPTEAGNYYLASDVTLSSSGGSYDRTPQWTVPEGTVNLCLNGKTITSTNNNRNDNFIDIPKGAELNLYDEEGNQGQIFGVDKSYGGSLMRVQGTFTMHGGAITGNKPFWYTLSLDGGTFVMEGGVMTKNIAVAGTVYGSGKSTITMNGGTISENQVGDARNKEDGGGVYVGSGCTFTMNGGTISDNKATGIGGGIFVDGGSFNLSGEATVKDNQAGGKIENGQYVDGHDDNVYLPIGSKINLTGEPKGIVGVYMAALSGGVFTQSSGSFKASDYKDKFVPDEGKFVVKAEGDELKMAREKEVPYLDAAGTLKKTDIYAPIQELGENPTEIPAGWYLVENDYDLPSRATVKGTVNLILGDNAKLEAQKGLWVDRQIGSGSYAYSSVLNIYAQSEGMDAGSLVATGGTYGSDNTPGIGTTGPGTGRVNVYGGSIKAVGSTNAAAIGGGYASFYDGGYFGINVGIYGGTLEAIGGEGAVAIGAGAGKDDHGTVFLGEKMKVLAGDDEASAEDVTATFEGKHDQKWVKAVPREAVSAKVTFKVANGSWDGGTDGAQEVELTGLEGDELKLAADQIPAVGGKPADGYKAGSWDVEPSADAKISTDTTYTYTYAAKDASDAAADAIAALPAKVAASDKQAVEAARNAYDKLTPAQKDAVPTETLAKLVNAETTLDALDSAAAAKKAQADAEASAKTAKDAQVKAEADKKAAEDAAAKAGADSKAAKEAQAKAEASAKTAEQAKAKAESDKEAAKKAQAKAQADKKKAQAAQKKAEKKAAAAKKSAFTPLAKTKLAKAKGGKKKVTLKWKTVRGAKGYQIVLSKNKKGTKGVKTYTVKGAKKAAKVIKKLKKGKYYVKVRAYKSVKGNMVYGKFGKAKAVKVK